MARANANVIGGGLAGASAALGLLRRGHMVTLYEQRQHWHGRVCGSFVNAEGVRHLDWLELLEAAYARGAAPVEQVEVTFASAKTKTPLRWTFPIERGLAFHRQTLEELLTKTVWDHGGRVLTGQRGAYENLKRPDEIIIAADGRFSKAVTIKKENDGWYGWNAAFTGALRPAGELSLHFYPRGYVGLLTFADGVTNVCGLVYRKQGEALDWETIYTEAHAQQPALAEKLRGAARRGEWHGVGPLPYTTEMRTSEFILTGDAAAVGDPFAGEGIGRALSAGPMIHHALCALDGAAVDTAALKKIYDPEWARAYNARLKTGALLRAMIRRPVAAEVFFNALTLAPAKLAEYLPIFHRGYGAGATAKFDKSNAS